MTGAGRRPLAPAGRRALARGLAAAALVLLVLLGAALVPPERLAVGAAPRALPPAPGHPLGTDLLGRDVAARTLAALGTSLGLGLLAAAASTLLALLLALAATLGRTLDHLVGALTELALGLPHLVLLILLAYAAGGGAAGVVAAVALTHWPRLARLLRLEAQTVAASDYVAASRALGRSGPWIARHHLAPHLLPQLGAGFVLVVPHAVLHEAGLSFLGLGLEPHQPSIGVMLAESLGAILGGLWWVAAAPGLALTLLALAVELFGEALRRALDPAEGAA